VKTALESGNYLDARKAALSDLHMNSEEPTFGKLLRDRRNYHGWTLKEVSKMTGLSVSAISKIENDAMSPTYDKILALAKGLNVEIADLLQPPNGMHRHLQQIMGRRSISRQLEGQEIETAFYKYNFLCSEVAHKRIIPIVVVVQAKSRGEMGELTTHVGEQYLYVLKGRIRFHTEFYEPVDLNTNDSVYVDATMGHGYHALDDEEAVVLINCSSATPNLAQTLREMVKEKVLKEERGENKSAIQELRVAKANRPVPIKKRAARLGAKKYQTKSA
jgi:transcriptional regulator with XRE-family HTH domain/quercetin dioxygenase-like cupin family protein